MVANISDKELELFKTKLISIVESNFTKNELSALHFKSLLNITDGLINTKINRKSQPFRKLLLECYDEVEQFKKPITRTESLNFYKNIVYPIGLYLTKYDGFYSKYDFHWHIYIGLFFDILLFFFVQPAYLFAIPIPIFTILLTLLGLYKRHRAIRTNKYFAYRW